MAMKIENIKAVRAAISLEKHWRDTEAKGFNMSRYAHSCGTPSCIAGWAVALKYGNSRSLPADFAALQNQGDIASVHQFYKRVVDEAADWLGLDIDDADELFCSAEWVEDLRGITPEQAVAVLDHLVETGEVDWSVAGEYF